MNSTILKGVTIGDNVIIGANSLVNKDIPSDCVAAGNPAKVICSLKEYRFKRIKAQTKEAVELAIEYEKKIGKKVTEKQMDEFKWLYTIRNKENISQYETKSKLTLNEFTSTNPKFNGFDDFLKYLDKCKENGKQDKK